MNIQHAHALIVEIAYVYLGGIGIAHIHKLLSPLMRDLLHNCYITGNNHYINGVV